METSCIQLRSWNHTFYLDQMSDKVHLRSILIRNRPCKSFRKVKWYSGIFKSLHKFSLSCLKFIYKVLVLMKNIFALHTYTKLQVRLLSISEPSSHRKVCNEPLQGTKAFLFEIQRHVSSDGTALIAPELVTQISA